MSSEPEVWLRGPIPGVHPLLMPAVHSLLQTREEVERITGALSARQFWERPAGAPSVGYHVRHLAGSLDRLLTYVRGEPLSPAQRQALSDEDSAGRPEPASVVRQFRAALDAGLAAVRAIDPGTLTEPRAVGRAGLPSTVIGLAFHAAEHAQRHAGQIATTARIVTGRVASA